MSASDAFASVYREGHWGRPDSGDFYSGLGSHDEAIVVPYVKAVRDFLASLDGRPDAVDLGCGDFNVGAQLTQSCGRYVACDVAPNLIERNRRTFAGGGLEFRVLNIVEDPLPDGDVVFVRQVLQHLSNQHIAQVLPKLKMYKWAVITEHLPPPTAFVPNVDITTGPRIRTDYGSGVVLDKPPFDLTCVGAREICLVAHATGAITTTVYQFA